MSTPEQRAKWKAINDSRKEYRKDYLKEYRKECSLPSMTDEERKEYWRKTNEKSKGYRMKFNIKYYYGLDIEQVKQMFVSQNGCCAICGNKFKEKRNSWHIDHNHSTKKVRALLCPKCNRGLGFFNEDIGILTKVIGYLNKWNMA